MASEHQPPEIIRRLAERRARHLRRSRPYRTLVVVAGFTVTLAGVIMLLTPGPALAVIPVGLAMLALEFAWAERVLYYAIRQAEAARQRALRATLMQRVLSSIATALAIAAIIAAAIVWDLPLLPL